MVVIAPQPGPQSAAITCPADLMIYGGAAGGGKTWCLLADPLQWVERPKFRGIIFRRETPQITAPGGLWDTAHDLYAPLKPKFMESPCKEVRFRSGARLTFSHLQHEHDKRSFDGSQIAFIGWDELTHFEESQFWYLQSRLRTDCGMKPYMRATCNPTTADDPIGGWVNHLVSWWIDQNTGFAIPERSGVIRWFYRTDKDVHWFDSAADAKAAFPDLAAEAEPTSFTFIPASLNDNQIMLRNNPGYRASLLSLTMVEREQKLRGNWKIRFEAGTVFQREWFKKYLESYPRDVKRVVRYWDNAASSEKNSDPTAGVLMAETMAGDIVVCDVKHGRWTTGKRREMQKQTAEEDLRWYPRCELVIEREPGSGGKDSAADSQSILDAYGVRFEAPQTNKVARAGNFSARAEGERGVYLVRAPWNTAYVDELVNFPTKGWHDDRVDASSGAFNWLRGKRGTPGGSMGASSR
jgi:predicted phage terminase large subunit-like protein